jgi:hypothetical protein
MNEEGQIFFDYNHLPAGKITWTLNGSSIVTLMI